MIMEPKNVLKKKPQEPKVRQPRFEKLRKRLGFKIPGAAKQVLETPKDILSGDILDKKEPSRLFSLLPWLTLLALLYITNNYHAETKIREINRLEKELKELRYQYITKKSKLMNMSKQSEIIKRIEDKGFKENTEPLKVIRVKKEELKSLLR